jgi:hypothetical protein
VGTYQQIRLLLIANDATGVTLSPPNQCGSQGFNCVVLHDGGVHQLQLSSQANTGLKIPPGQIVGGPITVNAGQTVDLNIDFNACASVIQQGNGQFRLKPTLTAGQVGTNTTGISGQVVSAVNNVPINLGSAGIIIVALEQQDATGADVVFQQKAANADGTFTFCPLPANATFDVVAVAIDAAGVAYNATVAVNVPGGTNIGAMPLVPETGVKTGPTTFQGVVTATTGSAAAQIDASVSALQTISFGGGTMRSVTIPAENNSQPSVADISLTSNVTCQINTNCATYTLNEPASNPSVGTLSAGKFTYSTPLAGNVPYTIRAKAFTPLSGGASDCSPSSITTTLDTNNGTLFAVAGTKVVPKQLNFSGCS